jgi:hypothetical protein
MPASIRCAVGKELGDIQRSVIERIYTLSASLTPRQTRDVAVNIFELFVVARVNNNAAVAGFLYPRALVLESSKSRSLNRNRIRIERVDLDDPAESVGLVGFNVRVKTRVRRVPLICRCRSDPYLTSSGVRVPVLRK